MKSIVMLKISSGRVIQVHAKLKEVQMVKDRRTGFGRYEAAAMVQAGSLEGLWQVLTCQIKPIPGVVEIFPCLISDDHSLEDPPEHVRELAGMRI